VPPGRRVCPTTGPCPSGSPPAARARCAWPARSPTASSSAWGTHRANITRTVEAIRAGAAEAGRDPSSVRVGAIFHTVLVDDPARALLMGKSMAAGYYEYSPALFEAPGFTWSGPDPEALKHARQVWPDFHHAADLEGSGRVADFLPAEAADAFCLRGGPREIVEQLVGVLESSPIAFDYVVLHPIPDPKFPVDPERDYTARVAREILPHVRARVKTRA
jgi:alkanesulfonate monooxygenase SsuD/methylene tetrahydromethanopterin reductase-like flavin-dependent oxidoreductase (luciferase family)